MKRRERFNVFDVWAVIRARPVDVGIARFRLFRFILVSRDVTQKSRMRRRNVDKVTYNGNRMMFNMLIDCFCDSYLEQWFDYTYVFFCGRINAMVLQVFCYGQSSIHLSNSSMMFIGCVWDTYTTPMDAITLRVVDNWPYTVTVLNTFTSNSILWNNLLFWFDHVSSCNFRFMVVALFASCYNSMRKQTMCRFPIILARYQRGESFA